MGIQKVIEKLKRRILVFSSIIFLTSLLHAQDTLCGEYSNSFALPETLRLYHNNTYYFHHFGCTDSLGTYTIKGDTLLLNGNTFRCGPQKFIIRFNFNNSTKTNAISLVEAGRLEDNKFSNFYKSAEYYNDTLIKRKISVFDDHKVEVCYYRSGSIESIKTFFKGKQHGTWYTYSEEGYLSEITIYKKGRYIKGYGRGYSVSWD